MLEATHLRTYIRDECIVFYRSTDEFGGLSNMAAGYGLIVNGISIRTSEALYQACRFPHLPNVQRAIVDEVNPLVAKRKTLPFRVQTRNDWNIVRHKVMRWCLRVKLAQNYEKFGELLLATGDFPIVEQSSKDDFWGAYVKGGNTLVGQNVLGRLLMELRERFKADSDLKLKKVTPLEIQDFLILGNQIETIDGIKTYYVTPQSRLC